MRSTRPCSGRRRVSACARVRQSWGAAETGAADLHAVHIDDVCLHDDDGARVRLEQPARDDVVHARRREDLSPPGSAHRHAACAAASASPFVRRPRVRAVLARACVYARVRVCARVCVCVCVYARPFLAFAFACPPRALLLCVFVLFALFLVLFLVRVGAHLVERAEHERARRLKADRGGGVDGVDRVGPGTLGSVDRVDRVDRVDGVDRVDRVGPGTLGSVDGVDGVRPWTTRAAWPLDRARTWTGRSHRGLALVRPLPPPGTRVRPLPPPGTRALEHAAWCRKTITQRRGRAPHGRSNRPTLEPQAPPSRVKRGAAKRSARGACTLGTPPRSPSDGPPTARESAPARPSPRAAGRVGAQVVHNVSVALSASPRTAPGPSAPYAAQVADLVVHPQGADGCHCNAATAAAMPHPANAASRPRLSRLQPPPQGT